MDAERLLATTEAAMEYAALRANGHCPVGMYILPSLDSLLVWEGVLFVHQGYYADATLPFRVRLPLGYPQRAPELVFVSGSRDSGIGNGPRTALGDALFHPLVDPATGALNVQARFAPWRPKEDRVFHLLHWVKAIFKKDVLDALEERDCPNKEAFRLYHASPASFASLAAQAAALSLSQSAPTPFSSAPMPGGPASRGASFALREFEGGEVEVDALRRRAGLRSWVDVEADSGSS